MVKLCVICEERKAILKRPKTSQQLCKVHPKNWSMKDSAVSMAQEC